MIGKGNISVKPDVTILTMVLSRIDESYDGVVKAATGDVRILKSLIEELGLDRDSLKTIHFDVDQEYESYRDDHDGYRKRFIGYRCRQTVRFTFPSDNRMLGKALHMISKSGLDPDLRISYTNSDPEGAKMLLIAEAIQDSKAKANVIAEAAGVVLGEIETIDYSWSTIRFESDVMCNADMCMMSSSTDSLDVDFTPEDIERSDEITIVWSIV